MPMWTWRMIWAPFKGREDFRWAPYLRSIFMEYLGAVIFTWMLSTVASVATGANVAVNGFTIGFAYMIFIIGAYSWRHSVHLPRHINPALTMGELWHQRIGIIVALPYWAAQIGGSFTAWPILLATGAAAIPNYATATFPVAYVGALFLELFLAFIPIFVYMHNLSIDIHSYQLYNEDSSKTNHFHRVAVLVGLTYAIVVFIGFPNGLYTFNMVGYLGPAAILGYGVPTGASWTIYTLFTLVSGVLAWAVHLLTWNMNGLTTDEIMSYVRSKTAEQAMGAAQIAQFIQANIKGSGLV